MRDVVIASAVRTPVGKFQGDLSGFQAPELGAMVVEEAVARAGVDPDAVDECIMGHVIQAGTGQNPARQAALNGGLPDTVAAFTLNKVCGSSLKAAMVAAQAIKAGDADVIVAGGHESMSNAPHLLPKARSGYRLGSAELLDSMIQDGLQDPFHDIHMGVTGEIVAEEYAVTRDDADELSVASHRKAAEATANGWFKDEILPVDVTDRKGNTRTITQDEGIREGTTAETLARLGPVFQEDGVVTAGNASQISDGAAATVVAARDTAEELGLPILARIVGYGTAGVEPKRVMAAPITGVQQLLDDTGYTVDDIDLFEHNEAFATASCAVRGTLGVPEDRFNVHGGAVALGHPLGATGARILTTLLHALDTHGEDTGLLTMCLGGGNAVQMIVERE